VTNASTPGPPGIGLQAGAASAVPAAPHRPIRTAGSKRGKHPRRDNLVAYLMLAPMVILLIIFVIIPFINAGYLSFFNWSFYKPSEFVGFRNFINVLEDPDFLGSVGRGLYYAAMVVPTGMVLAFVFANIVKGLGKKISGFVKTSVYIPTIISGVIASIIFTVIYDYSGGILNWFLGLLGIEPVAWLADPSIALPALAVPAVWIGFGITALIMLAGMLDIPDSYYEAASLDGAGWFKQMIFITIPSLKNVILYLLIAGFTLAIQEINLPLVMTQGGPLNSTLLPNLYLFDHFTQDTYQGQPIAGALLLFVVLGAISAAIFSILNSDKAVDG
jgi:ABC-type sugar transport systems, permease components